MIISDQGATKILEVRVGGRKKNCLTWQWTPGTAVLNLAELIMINNEAYDYDVLFQMKICFFIFSCRTKSAAALETSFLNLYPHLHYVQNVSKLLAFS